MKKSESPNFGNNNMINPSNSNSPLFSTNIITSNETNSDGSVQNTSEENAFLAREWVNDNIK